jgi:ornithine carbamoyltransferase
MAVNLRGRNLVSVNDFSAEEIWQVLKTAETLKLEQPAQPVRIRCWRARRWA